MAYSPSQRLKNQRNIVLGSCGFITLILLVALVRGTGLDGVVAGTVLALLVAVIMWWLFASKNAKPLPTDRKHARMYWVSKQWMERFGGDSQ